MHCAGITAVPYRFILNKLILQKKLFAPYKSKKPLSKRGGGGGGLRFTLEIGMALTVKYEQ